MPGDRALVHGGALWHLPTEIPCGCACVSAGQFFFFNDTATPEIYTLSLHDALPICMRTRLRALWLRLRGWMGMGKPPLPLAPSPVRGHKCAVEGGTGPGGGGPDGEGGPVWDEPR